MDRMGCRVVLLRVSANCLCVCVLNCVSDPLSLLSYLFLLVGCFFPTVVFLAKSREHTTRAEEARAHSRGGETTIAAQRHTHKEEHKQQ